MVRKLRADVIWFDSLPSIGSQLCLRTLRYLAGIIFLAKLNGLSMDSTSLCAACSCGICSCGTGLVAVIFSGFIFEGQLQPKLATTTVL